MMAKEGILAKSVFFKMPAWMLFLLIAGLISIVLFFLARLLTSNAGGIGTVFLIVGFTIVMAINGNSIMQDNGVDIYNFLLFGINVTFGPLVGILTALGSMLLALHLANRSTPIDFVIQKNRSRIYIQLAQAAASTLAIWVAAKFFGTGIFSTNLVFVYLACFTVGRATKGYLLIFYQRAPAFKFCTTTLIFYLVNYYEVLLFGAPFLAFLHGL